MIDSADQKRLVKIVERDWQAEVQTAQFKAICAGKERGHRIADFAEERTVAIVENEKFDIAFQLGSGGKRRARSMGDFWLRSGKPRIYNPVNVKAGIAGVGGQPNMVSLGKLTKALLSREIDSYWLLLIRLEEGRAGFTPTVKLKNILDYLDFMHFDSGPGQIMLRSDAFYAHLVGGGKARRLSVEDAVEELLEMRRDGDLRLVRNRSRALKRLEAAVERFDASKTIDQTKVDLGP